MVPRPTTAIFGEYFPTTIPCSPTYSKRSRRSSPVDLQTSLSEARSLDRLANGAVARTVDSDDLLPLSYTERKDDMISVSTSQPPSTNITPPKSTVSCQTDSQDPEVGGETAADTPDKFQHFFIEIMYKFIIKLFTVFMCLGQRSLAAAAAQLKQTTIEAPSSSLVSVTPPEIKRGKLCASEIYCHGALLDTVQKAHIFEDSKHFVDMKLKHPPAVVLDKFKEFMTDYPNPTPAKIKGFVFDNFDPPGSELMDVIPDDFSETPDFLNQFKDADVKEWASELHQLWKKLTKKVVDDVRDNPNLYSILYVPHPTVVPGGRFREFYYWDSYWTIRGLLVSGMQDTVRGMLINFLTLVERFGFVPNGGRLYYSQRSQPPFLIPMVKEYVEATGDWDFLKANIHTLEKEYNFWERSRTDVLEKDGKKYKLSRYNTFGNEPRPESYREDIETAEGLSPKAQANLHSHIQAACESGWDFSTRWFKTAGNVEGTLQNLYTRNIYPVDLNSLLVMNCEILRGFHQKLGNNLRALHFDTAGRERNESLQTFLYDEEEGMWFDYDRKLNKPRKEFFASNIFPLWTESYPLGERKQEVIEKALSYMRRKGVLSYPGGFPTSLSHSQEQWDFPNGWAPLQHVVIEGLEKTEHPEAISLAAGLAKSWMRNNYLTWRRYDAMYEKYSTSEVGYPGGGGEYRVVDGFGWTNGVCLDLLTRYPTFDTHYDDEINTKSSAPPELSPEDLHGDLVLSEIITRL